jgi:tryptophan synthase alpha chain
LPPDLAANVRQLKSMTDRPVCVGFGISQPSHVAELQGVADGAIVGSAYVKRMKPHLSHGAAALAREVGSLTRELLSAVRL